MTTRSCWLFSLLGGAAFALAGLGCSSNVNDGLDGAAGDGDGGGAPASCPRVRPTHGSPCDDPGEMCRYQNQGSQCITAHDDATCTDGKWSVIYKGDPACDNPCYPDSCPPHIDCPADPPTDGSSCPNLGGSSPGPCDYTVLNGCGGTMLAEYTCEGTWHLEGGGADCTPTQLCNQHGSSEDCASDAGCKWLEPGCDGGMAPPSLAKAGCFPHAACISVADVCQDGESCTEVTIDPCWDATCGVCGATTYVCVQP